MKNIFLVLVLFGSLFLNYVTADNLYYCPAYAKVYSNQMSFQFLDGNMQPYNESSFKWFPFQSSFHLGELFVLSSITSTKELSSGLYNDVCSYIPQDTTRYPDDAVSITPYAVVDNQQLSPIMSYQFKWRVSTSTPSLVSYHCESQQQAECPFTLVNSEG